MIQAVFFDYEGVIAAKSDHKLSEQLAHNLGISPERAWELLAPEQHGFLTGRVSVAELWRHIEQQYGKSISISARDIWYAYG